MSSSPTTKTPAATVFLCDCERWMRSVCEGLPFYKKHEGKRYCVLHYPGKDKVSAFDEALKRKLDAQDFDFRGVWFPDKVNFSKFTFTTPANFNSATFSAEANFYSATFSATARFNSATFSAEANFFSAMFSAVADFTSATFSAEANFYSATFSAEARFTSATFSAEARFTSATFSAEANFFSAMFSAVADFTSATFSAKARFNYATFSAVADFFSAMFSAVAYFTSATFSAEARFTSATFSAEAYFTSATFSAKADFFSVTFKDYVRFAGGKKEIGFLDDSSLNLQFAKIEKPDRLSFHTISLRPHWFVNVDARKFEFINVDWSWRDTSIKQEIKSIGEEDVLSRHRLLAIACRNLAVNAEENHRYEEASRFRYMAMEARRLERWRGFAFWTLGWWYWLASGYGERVWRAFVVLIGVWLVAAALYTRVGFARWEPRVSTEQEAAEARRDEVGEPLRVPRALTYSLGVMTLQKPEPRPATNAAQTLVMLETILGPVQAALLALAIRRKFMR